MIRSYFSKFISLEALIPLMAILLLMFFGLRLLGAKTTGFKKQQKNFFYYLLIHLAIMAIIIGIVYNLKQSTLMLRYFSLMVYALTAGGFHVFFFHNTFKKFDSDHTFKEFMFALITAMVTVLPIIMIVSYFDDLIFLPYYFLVSAAFVLPTSFCILFNYSIAIPVKLYSKWYYPLDKSYDSPKHNELKNMIVLNFMFYKSTRAQHMTRFKAKAPRDMDFGRLFFFFINDYNDKKTTAKIEMTENSGSPYGWYFYLKPKWYGTLKHVDAETTVEKNDLEDGDVVVCQRI